VRGGGIRKRLKNSPSVKVATGIVVLAYGLAFLQRPGRTFTDTRIELTIDPVRFLHAVAQMWSPTGDLGHVQSGEFIGYLVPMSPWYAFAHTIGIPTWLAQRIWLGTLLAVAGLGVLRLLAALLPRRAPVAEAVAGLLFVANPYVVVVVGRTSAWLVAYAALPWILLAVHRGIRGPGRWRWPATIALVMLFANGGVNAALPFWIAIAAIALVAYEVAVMRRATWRSAGWFAVRTIVCVAVVSLWWVVPVLMTTKYAPNFLSFTEQPLTILTTPSVSESLRLLGYWVVYYGLSGGPATPSSGASAYLFEPLVILATFLVPLVAFAGFAWTRRWPYAPFFVMLGAATVIAMSLGFPPGSPLNRLLVPAYYHVGPLQVIRTAWKAAPLAALSLACLAGVATEAAVTKARSSRGLRLLRRRIPAGALMALAPIPVLWALPLFNGTAIHASLAYGSVPHYWRAALHDASRTTTANQRIMVFPGELFGWYRWGETVDSALPFLTPRRLTIREIERHSDLRASQLQIAIDDLVQQDRLVPGQLEPLMRLLGAGSVLVAADGSIGRDGALDPAGVALALRDQPEFARSAQSYGKVRIYTPEQGRDGPPVALPDVRRYSVPNANPGVVRVHPFGDTTVLDGDAYGVTELAANGMFEPQHALVYAADTGRARLSSLVNAGARLVFSDSNRLRVVAPSTTAQDLGPTLEPGDPIADDSPYYALFPKRAAAAETVATYTGLTYLRTPGPHRAGPIFPEDSPYAALDGSLNTAWLADPQAPVNQRYLELKLRTPRVVHSISLYPLDEPLGATTGVAVSVNGGPSSSVSLNPGWNQIPIDSEPLRRLRITITSVFGAGTAGGITELRIPGLQVRESLRLPTDLATAAQGLDLSHNDLSILVARTTADLPRREHPDTGNLQARSVIDAQDSEHDISRIVTLPESRSFALAGWGSVRADAPDPLLDRLAGVRAGWTFSSSDRYEGVPINRASSALDGEPATAWAAEFNSARNIYPWIQWSRPRPLTVSVLRLVRGPPRYDFPSVVRVTAPGAPAQDLPVQPDGTVVLTRALHTRTLRLQVRAAQPPIGKARFLRFLGAVAIAEIDVPGLKPPPIPRRGTFATRCGALSMSSGAHRAPAVVYGTLAALDQGEPLRLRGCGGHQSLSLSRGANVLYAPAGPVMQADHLVLDSPALEPLPAPAAETIASPGTAHSGSQNGVRPGVGGPSWLVLGEGYSTGWQAWCRDRSGHEHPLGPAQPIDGYANGWRIGAACVSARMAFAPQATANLAFVISAVAALLMLLLVLGVRLPMRILQRLRRPAPAPAPPAEPVVGEVTGAAFRYGLLTAAAAGLAVELFGALVFAPRFGAVAGSVMFLLVLTGIGVRRLVLLASVGLVVVPILYLTGPVSRQGGSGFYFSLDHLAAHWIAAGAVIAVAGAAVLQARGLRAQTKRGTSKPSAQSEASSTTLGEAPVQEHAQPAGTP
jgi:arabinofuranan 3-O-arabinosyltransferase